MPRPEPSLGRTWLFVPGDRPDRFDQAWDSGSDQVIIDLEDAVAPANKDAARKAVAAWMTLHRPVWVRANACDTPWYPSDVELAAHPGLVGLIIPKAEHLPPGLLDTCEQHHKAVIPLVETAVGFKNLPTLAAAAGVERLAFGSIDFQVDMGIEGDDDALAYFRSQLVLASRLAQVHAPIDGVTTDITDTELLQHDARRARRFGFGGKLCIHPRQIDIVNRVFLPSDEELAWARMVIAAGAQGDGAVVTVSGHMVDKPVLVKAQKIVRAADTRRVR